MPSLCDQTLEKIIREWATIHDPSRFKIVAEPEMKGCPASFHVYPTNPKSATVILWVGDDGASVSFALGGGLWWDGAIPLEAAAVQDLLETVAAGHVEMQVRKVFGRIVARRGKVGALGTKRHEYGSLTPSAIFPGLKWETVSYPPYFSDTRSDG